MGDDRKKRRWWKRGADSAADAGEVAVEAVTGGCCLFDLGIVAFAAMAGLSVLLMR